MVGKRLHKVWFGAVFQALTIESGPQPILEPIHTASPIACHSDCGFEESSINSLRAVLGLAPGVKYSGDFTEFSDASRQQLLGLAVTIIDIEVNRSDSISDYMANLRLGATRCSSGLASAHVILFALQPSVSNHELAERAFFPVFPLRDADCMGSPFWLFDIESAWQNIFRFKNDFRAHIIGDEVEDAASFEWERVSTVQPSCQHDGGVDSCCDSTEWFELEEKLRDPFSHPRWFDILPLPLHYLMTRIAPFGLDSWWKLFPWISHCFSGHISLLLTHAIHTTKQLDERAGLALANLLSRYPLESIAASRFPVFGLLGQLLETDADDAMPGLCQSDLLNYFRAALDGRTAFSSSVCNIPAIGKGLSHSHIGPFVDSIADESICRQQMLVTLATVCHHQLSYGPLSFHDAVSWLKPIAWPLWSSLHTLWPNAATVSIDHVGVVWSLTSWLRASNMKGVADSLKSIDYNGWQWPVVNMNSEMDDDWWTTALDKELDQRLSRRSLEVQKAPLRVALLETSSKHYDGFLNMARGWPKMLRIRETGEWNTCGPVIHHDQFILEWNDFLANPDSTADGMPKKFVGRFDPMPLGLVMMWKADFVAWPPRPSPAVLEQVAIYDLLIVLDPSPPGRPPQLPPVPGQVRLWMPWEPYSLQGKVSLPADYCPIVLDQFGVAKVPSILFWHHYLVSAWRKAFPIVNDSVANVSGPRNIFVFYRKGASNLVRTLESSGYNVLSSDVNTTKAEYQESLQSTWLAVLPTHRAAARWSSGQVLADAAIARCVPTFAPRTKLFARLIMPAFLSYRSNEELLTKIHLLALHPDWYVAISKEICRRLRYIDALDMESASQLLQRVQEEAKGDQRCKVETRNNQPRDFRRYCYDA